MYTPHRFALILWVLCLGLAVGNYLGGHPIQERLLNADALYLPTLFADLFQRDGKWSDWYLTPAPYLFPDYIIFLPAYLLGTNIYLQVALFFVLQLVATYGVAKSLYVATQMPFSGLSAAVFTIVLTWLALSLIHPYDVVLSSGFHYGCFLASMLSVALWLHPETPGQSTRKMLTLGAIAYAASLSDALYLVQCSLPLWLVAYVCRVSPARRCSAWGILICSVLGWGSYGLWIPHSTRYSAQFDAQLTIYRLDDLSVQLFTLLDQHPGIALVAVAYVGLSIYALYSVFRRRGNFVSETTPDDRIVLTWTWGAILFSLAAVCLSVNLVLSFRYLLPIFYWPIFILIGYAIRRAPVWSPRLGVLISTCAVTTLAYSSYELHQKNGLTLTHYPQDMACIDAALEKYQLRNGFTGYWEAKPVQNFSHLALNIAQYSTDLMPFTWITSDRYFNQNYDFFITPKKVDLSYNLSPEKIALINGPARHVIDCGSLWLHAYAPGQLRVKREFTVGKSYTWPACQLRTAIGKATEACEMEKRSLARSGSLTLGPYEPLPAGTYDVELRYSSTAPTTQSVGQWERVLMTPAGNLDLGQDPIAGSAGRVALLRRRVQVTSSAAATGKFAIRVEAHAGWDLKSMGLQITRVE